MPGRQRPARGKAARAEEGSSRRRTQEEARREIVEAARNYLSKHGFQGLTVGRLMQRTQIGRSAFYVYFKDIYDLARFFILELYERVDKGGAGWFDGDGPPLERIRAGLMNTIPFWEENGRMIRALELAAQQDERLAKLWRERIAVRIERIEQAIERDQAAGLIGPLDANEMATALNRFNVTYLNDSFGTGRPKDKRKVIETMERVWTASLYGRIPAASALVPRKRR